MESSFDTIVQIFSRHSYVVLFAAMALENTLLLGLVIPGITVLVVAGYLVQGGELGLVPSVVAAVGGTLLGDNINYMIGRFGVGSVGWVRRIIDRHSDVRGFIQHSPSWYYYFFHFPVYLRTIFPLVLGSFRFPVTRWLKIDLGGSLLFCPAYLGLGYFLGGLSEGVSTALQWGNALVIFFSVLLGWWLVRLVSGIVRRRKHRETTQGLLHGRRGSNHD